MQTEEDWDKKRQQALEDLTPRVINKYTSPTPKGAVYIGRPSKFGNPFEIGKDGDRSQVLQKYKEWLKTQPELIRAIKEECKGKVLVCFCKPKACHGDLIFHIANKKGKINEKRKVRQTKSQ